MSGRRSGDGFLRCGDGHVRWGIFGAAGVVFTMGAGQGATVMMQKRSEWSHEGGVWSCPGGALDEGETPYEGALREASEEIGVVPSDHHLMGEYVFEPAGDWRYTTIVVAVSEQFGQAMNFETDRVEWVPVTEVAQRPLHPGFAAAWPSIERIIVTR